MSDEIKMVGVDGQPVMRKPPKPKRQKECSAKEERFAVLVANGRAMAEAYRMVFRVNGEGKEETAYANATRCAGREWVRARIDELRSRALTRANARQDVTTDTLLAECSRALAIAEAKRDANAMATVTKLKAQLTGLLVKERDNARAPLQDVPDEQVAAELARLREEREASSRQIH